MFPLHAIKNAIVHLWYANFSLILSRTRKVLAKYIISFEFESGSSVELNQQLNQSDRGFSGFGDVSAAGAKLLNSKFCVIYVLTKEQMAFQARFPICSRIRGMPSYIWPAAGAPAANMCSLKQEQISGGGLGHWYGYKLLGAPFRNSTYQAQVSLYLHISISTYLHIRTSAYPHILFAFAYLRLRGLCLYRIKAFNGAFNLVNRPLSGPAEIFR